ncbi:hypothetical protein THL1_4187 [Pseudomonas sp. TCU-HL1]|nr:hypothetical protein THL1_4187 [Pseudomonas sp. TCU-HL1]
MERNVPFHPIFVTPLCFPIGLWVPEIPKQRHIAITEYLNVGEPQETKF